ncbi:MAG: Regulatory protein AtoC [Phycisphaerae bacterium]|nr:Regulatory protein AtoC [Phycisphaerae bacterium]
MTRAADILVIDDEEAICFAFQRYFAQRGHAVSVAATGDRGLALYRKNRPEVIFLDVRLPDSSGLEVLESIRNDDPDACVIVMTAYGSMETVTRAIRGGAFDYLVKPLDLDRARELVEQALASRAAQPARAGESADPAEASQIIGASRAMQEVYKQIVKVATSSASVLIRGATGTGKEVVARAIHEHSGRRNNAFVAINCGALPESLVESELFGYARGAFTGAAADKPGRFESAAHGTLFLDEVGELPPPAQVKLLRFLDSHRIERLGSVNSVTVQDVRVLAATNRDLSEAIAAGHFREDLFYRLAEIQIELPALRDRVSDIGPLARHFVALASGGQAPPISPEALRLLEQYSWPGNVRELQNAVRQAAVASAGRPILPAHLPEAVQHGRPPAGHAADEAQAGLARFIDAIESQTGPLHPRAVEQLERELIRRAMAHAGGNQSAAAERLGLHRNTLRTKLRDLGLADSDGSA